MNWVKYYMLNSGSYYGATLMANWVADMKQIDPTKITTAAVVFKEYGQYSMPGLALAPERAHRRWESCRVTPRRCYLNQRIRAAVRRPVR